MKCTLLRCKMRLFPSSIGRLVYFVDQTTLSVCSITVENLFYSVCLHNIDLLLLMCLFVTNIWW